MNSILITKAVNRKLGLSGLENNRATRKFVARVLETAKCECENRCTCRYCQKYGCEKCFVRIVNYVVNIKRRERLPARKIILTAQRIEVTSREQGMAWRRIADGNLDAQDIAKTIQADYDVPIDVDKLQAWLDTRAISKYVIGRENTDTGYTTLTLLMRRTPEK